MTTIRAIDVLCTAPAGRDLVIAKVYTSDDALYGLGCGTFTQRFEAVVSALKHHLIPLVIGRDVWRIEERFRLMRRPQSAGL